MLCIDSKWPHTIRPREQKKYITEPSAQEPRGKNIDSEALLPLDQKSKKVTEKAHQPNACCANVQWIISVLQSIFKALGAGLLGGGCLFVFFQKVPPLMLCCFKGSNMPTPALENVEREKTLFPITQVIIQNPRFFQDKHVVQLISCSNFDLQSC